MNDPQLAPDTAAAGAHSLRWYVVHAYSGMEKAVERHLGNITPVIASQILRDRTGHAFPNETAVGNLFVLGFSRFATYLNGGDLLFDGGWVLTY